MTLSQEQLYALQQARETSSSTLRETVPALEEVLYKPFPVLDHGFVRVIDYMGSDSAIVQAARVSYGKGTKHVQQDRGLINYLMRHWHTTPFEMCEIKYHIKLPIFVARQWIRHRTANVNEYSARYSILGKEFYIPTTENLATQSEQNRQGRGKTLAPHEAHKVLKLLQEDAERVYQHYEEMMNANEQGDVLDSERSGLTRELARINLTLNYYTEWYWKIDLHNLFHFLRLRADHHAQYEIRAYADAMLQTVKLWVPLAYEAFVEYRQQGGHLSCTALNLIRQLLQGSPITRAQSGLSLREWQELENTLGVNLEEVIDRIAA
jgi:thymidylate synthase (FAD)